MPETLPYLTGGSVVTVGTFDGLHRGHVALLEELKARARHEGAPAVVATFHPHPLVIVRPEAAPQLLTPREEKLELLAQLGLDAVVMFAFDHRLAAWTPDRFATEILVRRLGARRIVIGYDHGFGRDRSGDADTLREIGAREGFDVSVVDPISVAGVPVSSSTVRRALAEGDLATARAMLGRAYELGGHVIRGDGRGRALGFPTANLQLPEDKLLPLEGIYAVRVDHAGILRDGVLHLGPRPTYPGAGRTVEVHLFDFEGDLYTQRLRVRLCARLRDIERYAGAAELSAAIAADCEAARHWLGSGAGACDNAGAVLS